MDILWGAKAAASDAWAGTVVGAVIDSDDRRVTHVLVRRGVIIRRVVAAPIANASQRDANAIYFDMTFSDMRALPENDAPGFFMSRSTRVEFRTGGNPRVLGVRVVDETRRVTQLVLSGMAMENRLLLPLEDVREIASELITTTDEALDLDDLPSYREDRHIEYDAWETLYASGDVSPTDLHGIAVAVVEGRVTVTGNVRERRASQDVCVMLRTVEGVLSVEDETVSDRELEMNLTTFLAREHRDVFDRLLVHSQLGRVEIGGPIQSEASMHAIMQRVRSMSGVREVEDNLVLAGAVPVELDQEVSEE